MTDFKEYIFTTIKDYLGSLHFTRASAITSVYNNLNTPFNEHTDNVNTITFSVDNETSPGEIIDIIKSKLYHYATVEVCSITVEKVDTKITITLIVTSPNYQSVTESFLLNLLKKPINDIYLEYHGALFPGLTKLCEVNTHDVPIVHSVCFEKPRLFEIKKELIEFITTHPNNIYLTIELYVPDRLFNSKGEQQPSYTIHYIEAPDYHYGRYNRFGPHPVGLQQND